MEQWGKFVAGETLLEIAFRKGKTIDDLLTSSEMTAANQVETGSEFVIPADG